AHPVVPAAMVLEWMAEVAADVAPGLRVSSIRDLRVLKGVVLDGADRQLTLAWEPCATDRTAALRIEVRREPGGPGPHYRAVGERASGEGVGAPIAPAEPLPAEPYPHPVDEIYRSLLFHGPTFHGIERVLGMSEDGASAVVRTSS